MAVVTLPNAPTGSLSAQHIPALELRGGSSIPQLGFGVFKVPPGDTERAVSLALEAGYRHIDTAAAYHNEAGVGRAIRASAPSRGEVFITTKLWNSDHGHERAIQACERSLAQLGIDYVDLYLIHWPLPMAGKYVETWQALVDLQATGRARAIGVSNFTEAHLQRVANETGVVPVLNQVELHPRLQQAPLRAFHERQGILTEAWSPLAKGRLLDDPTIVRIAETYEKTPAQVVLRWHIELGNVVIPKSVTPERIRANLDVFDFTLSDSDLAAIEALNRDERTGPAPDTFDLGA